MRSIWNKAKVTPECLSPVKISRVAGWSSQGMVLEEALSVSLCGWQVGYRAAMARLASVSGNPQCQPTHCLHLSCHRTVAPAASSEAASVGSVLGDSLQPGCWCYLVGVKSHCTAFPLPMSIQGPLLYIFVKIVLQDCSRSRQLLTRTFNTTKLAKATFPTNTNWKASVLCLKV